jgi:hypothetical protein
VKWNVRAVDLVAGVAMVGILGAGGILALGAYDGGVPDAPAAPQSDYGAGTIPADEFESDDGTSEEGSGTQQPADAGKHAKRGKGSSRADGPGFGAGSPIVFPGDPVPPAPVAQPVEFVISSFNILGSSHTTGDRPRFASGPTRARAVGQLLLAHKVEIVGFQEMQNNQRAVIESMVGDRYAMFPGASMSERESVNSIAWDVDRWEAVDSRLVDIPYFGGSIRKMPVVKLQNRSNDAQVWVANFHNPADSNGPAEQWRDRAQQIEVALANDLIEQDKVPVLFTGDFNEREDVFCAFTAQTPLTAANGGSNDGVCRPPQPTYIDWVFGHGVEWLSQLADKSALVHRTTDHPMIVVHALLQPPEGSAAAQEAADALSRTEDAEKR